MFIKSNDAFGGSKQQARSFDILKRKIARYATIAALVCRLTVLNGIVAKGIKADLCDRDIAGLTGVSYGAVMAAKEH